MHTDEERLIPGGMPWAEDVVNMVIHVVIAKKTARLAIGSVVLSVIGRAFRDSLASRLYRYVLSL